MSVLAVRTPRAALAAAFAIVLLSGCHPSADRRSAPLRAATTPFSAGEPAPEPTPGERARAAPRQVDYRIGVARLGTGVVVVESSGAPDDDPLLHGLGWARPPALPLPRTTVRPDPLVSCFGVVPWSLAGGFRGTRYASATDPGAAINQFVLRYGDEGHAAAEVVRIRHDLAGCGALRLRLMLRGPVSTAGYHFDELVIAHGRLAARRPAS